MHIIKITPQSFKIILSKEDLQRHGVENVLDKADFSSDFFAEIIDKTNAMYGNPFSGGSVDAEFFGSKDGGGELFICSSKNTYKSTTYLFRTHNCEDLIGLCSRLAGTRPPEDSRLYHEDGRYSLLLFYRNRDAFLVSVMKEYGNASEISKLQTWLLEEHAEEILGTNAVHTIAESF